MSTKTYNIATHFRFLMTGKCFLFYHLSQKLARDAGINCRKKIDLTSMILAIENDEAIWLVSNSFKFDSTSDESTIL